MCGIVGWVNLKRKIENERSVLENMNNKLYWRGPDAEGFWISSHAMFAHRRLIVIDPEGGLQPMVFKESGRTISLTYNGEIYNFQEIRSKLISLGHNFSTRSDTEVVLRSYVEWGVECVKQFNGIFAFAIWDDAKKRLFLARDHLGVKPLFYSVVSDSFLFASEIKALLAHPSIKPEIDSTGLSRILTLGFAGATYVPEETVYKDIKEVRPGHIALFDKDGVHVRRYWMPQSRQHTDSLDETVANVRELLFSAITRQLVADRPVVSLLSGGLDSSGVASVASLAYQNEGREPLKTYSVDFSNSEQDFQKSLLHRDLDTPWARRVAEHSKTNHNVLVVTPEELVEHLPISYRSHDLPGGGEMETSLYLLFKHVKKDATVALSGESADEVFGGYPWFHTPEAFDVHTFPWLVTVYDYLNDFNFVANEYKEVVSPKNFLAREYEKAISELPKLEGESKQDAKIREQFYLNITRFLPTLLNRKDRMSMATGLEVRVPFCDYRLVEYVWNIPWKMKTVDNIEKGILRRAFSEVLPKDVVMRRKSAYPFSCSPIYLENLQNRVQDILNDPESKITPFVDKNFFVETLKSTKSASKDVSTSIRVLDCILQIEEWMREYQVKVYI